MDGQRFDEITRSMARPGSRRGFLAGLVGAAAVMTGARGAAAAGRPLGATCIRNGSCASEVCDPRSRRCVDCVDDGDCIAPETCGGGGVVQTCGCTPLSFEQVCGGEPCGAGPGADTCGGTYACTCPYTTPAVIFVANVTDGVTNGAGFPIPNDGTGFPLRQICFDGPNSFTSAATCPVVSYGGYTSWAYSYRDNRGSFAIVTYDRNGTVVEQREAVGARYLYQITVDEPNTLVRFFGQSGNQATSTFADLQVP